MTKEQNEKAVKKVLRDIKIKKMMVFAFFILLAVLVWGIGNAIVKGINLASIFLLLFLLIFA